MPTLVDATNTKICRKMLKTWTFSMPLDAYIRWLANRDYARALVWWYR